jgi:hypothetical protein
MRELHFREPRACTHKVEFVPIDSAWVDKPKSWVKTGRAAQPMHCQCVGQGGGSESATIGLVEDASLRKHRGSPAESDGGVEDVRSTARRCAYPLLCSSRAPLPCRECGTAASPHVRCTFTSMPCVLEVSEPRAASSEQQDWRAASMGRSCRRPADSLAPSAALGVRAARDMQRRAGGRASSAFATVRIGAGAVGVVGIESAR